MIGERKTILLIRHAILQGRLKEPMRGADLNRLWESLGVETLSLSTASAQAVPLPGLYVSPRTSKSGCWQALSSLASRPPRVCPQGTPSSSAAHLQEGVLAHLERHHRLVGPSQGNFPGDKQTPIVLGQNHAG